MAQHSEIQKLILEKIENCTNEIKEVRQKDIPGIHTLVATLQSEIEHVKEKTSVKSMIITAVGGLIAVGTSIAVTYFK